MRAITVLGRAAGVGGLVLTEPPHPHAADNDVTVQVHAAGFTPGELDWPGTWTDRGRGGRDVPADRARGAASPRRCLRLRLRARWDGRRSPRRSARATYHRGRNWIERPRAHHVLTGNLSRTNAAKLLVVFVSNAGDRLKIDDPLTRR